MGRAELDEADLAPLHSGYRAPYILAAAKAVASGELDLEKTGLLPCTEARAELKKLNGVGDKVANCVVLFGLHQLDAFPVDVWIKRALAENLPKGFDPSTLGKYAGLAQQRDRLGEMRARCDMTKKARAPACAFLCFSHRVLGRKWLT